jgi:two-component system, cell cycle response regulator
MSGHILIVDDLSINRTILRARLNAACYSCIMAATGAEALAIAHDQRPDLILLDYRLPDLDGEAVCRTLRADPVTRDIPLILFSASTERELRLQALRAGADEFLAKPLDESYLLGRIRSLLRASDSRTGWEDGVVLPELSEHPAPFERASSLAVVTDQIGLTDPALTRIAGNLSQLTVQQALRMGADSPCPDTLLLAPDVIQNHGLQIIAELRARAHTRDADLCVMMPAGQDLMAAMALDLGAAEVLRLPLDAEETRLRLSALARTKSGVRARAVAMAAQLDQALRDPLTGLHNRRHLVSELWRFAQTLPAGRVSAGVVLVLDLDHFKGVNDRYGHNAGDDVLVDIAGRIRGALRKTDILARYGGEEFVILLPDADLPTGQTIATRIAHAVQASPCLPMVGGGVRITASIGVARVSAPQSNQTPEDYARAAIGAADTALRAAKLGGRNRVVTEHAASA